MTLRIDGPAPIRIDAVVNPDRLIFEAAVHPPGLSDAQRRFLWNSYERALRRAQGWR